MTLLSTIATPDWFLCITSVTAANVSLDDLLFQSHKGMISLNYNPQLTCEAVLAELRKEPPVPQNNSVHTSLIFMVHVSCFAGHRDTSKRF